MVLVSLLVNQLSSPFLTFFGRPKKICSVSGNFWSVSELFLVRLWFFGIPKRNLVDQKNRSLTKTSLRLNNFFFCWPKKGRNRLDNWSTKRLTKTTWTGLITSSFHWLPSVCSHRGHLCQWNFLSALSALLEIVQLKPLPASKRSSARNQQHWRNYNLLHSIHWILSRSFSSWILSIQNCDWYSIEP